MGGHDLRDGAGALSECSLSIAVVIWKKECHLPEHPRHLLLHGTSLD